MPREVYLDTNATHPLLTSVRRSMAEILLSDAGELGNPSSSHARGREAKRLLNRLKTTFLDYLKRPAQENVLLTSGATESINLVLRGLYEKRRLQKSTLQFWTSSVEHAAVLSTLSTLETTPQILKVDASGQIPAEEWERLWTWIKTSSDDLCLSLQSANNESGVCLDLLGPLKKLRELFPEGSRKLWVHLDMAQALGKVAEENLSALMELSHFASFSAHKFGAPSGIGALWCKSLGCFTPIITGGGQEEGFRSGTWNALGAFGFLKALEVWKEEGVRYRAEMKRLRNLALARLEKLPGFQLHGAASIARDWALPNTLNFSFKSYDTDTLIPSMDLSGFRVSGTSACSSGAQKSSHVILAMGYGERAAKNSVRFSLGAETTQADVEAFCQFLESKIQK
jgi:cysteine desulfurase